MLYCGGGTGQMREERLLRLPQQASALALFQPGQGGCNAGGEVWVAAGLWMSNEVVLQPLSAEQPAARLGLAHHQPRSLAVCQLGGSGGGRHLVAGTSSGEVVWWRLVTRLDASGAVCGVQLEEGGWARAGLAAVSLHALHQPGILAVSDQALLLAAPHPERSPAAARVHGGQGLTAACALPAGSQPQANSLAYIQAGRLHIGCLEPGVQLRWDEAALGGGAAPRAAAYHAASGCAAVACSERGGGSSLRLVDVGAMREVARVPLPPRHTVTALAVAPLPCSSGWQRQASGHGGEAGAGAAAYGQPQAQAQQPGCAQFLLVATAPERGAAPPSHGSGEGSPAAGEERLPLPADSDASQPWWRQQGQQGQQGQQQDGVPWRPQGSLSVYEVRFRSPPPGDSSTTRAACSGEGSASDSTRWELALHGTCPLPAAALSLAVVHPEAEPLYASPAAAAEDGAATASSSEPAPAAPAAAATQPPLLAAGCDDGAVRLYRCELRHGCAQLATACRSLPLPLPSLCAVPAAASQPRSQPALCAEYMWMMRGWKGGMRWSPAWQPSQLRCHLCTWQGSRRRMQKLLWRQARTNGPPALLPVAPPPPWRQRMAAAGCGRVMWRCSWLHRCARPALLLQACRMRLSWQHTLDPWQPVGSSRRCRCRAGVASACSCASLPCRLPPPLRAAPPAWRCGAALCMPWTSSHR